MFSITPYKEIQDSLGFWIPRCGFRIPGTGFQFLSVELEFWIPIVSGIPDSLSCIPDSKAQDSRFHQQKFPDSEILIPLHGAISIFFHYCLFSTSSPGLFPQKMGGAGKRPHPFFEGKALGRGWLILNNMSNSIIVLTHILHN